MMCIDWFKARPDRSCADGEGRSLSGWVAPTLLLVLSVSPFFVVWKIVMEREPSHLAESFCSLTLHNGLVLW